MDREGLGSLEGIYVEGIFHHRETEEVFIMEEFASWRYTSSRRDLCGRNQVGEGEGSRRTSSNSTERREDFTGGISLHRRHLGGLHRIHQRGGNGTLHRGKERIGREESERISERIGRDISSEYFIGT